MRSPRLVSRRRAFLMMGGALLALSPLASSTPTPPGLIVREGWVLNASDLA
jgi:hypothetical protein